MIKTTDDAKEILLEEFKKVGDWQKVELNFRGIAERETGNLDIDDLIDWYKDDIERVVYLGRASGVIRDGEILLEEGIILWIIEKARASRDGEILLEEGIILWIIERLNEAYQGIIEEQGNMVIEKAQRGEQ
jgi:hypothetical protein